ncbi:hypothetical protein N7527_000341 [Penicillium freii]|uniref:Uncharacterized protein n=1 Tax=Penicillium freii TaxID=48697 RepID=A0A117NN30_PENFR|nr:hypothetical protein N7527_000341 [Penicillium freii]KUM60172.1 hypothetical protein ACN42_g6963 [Penicillium freii]
MCAFYSDIINHQLSLFPAPILDAPQSLETGVWGHFRRKYTVAQVHCTCGHLQTWMSILNIIQPLVPSTIGIVHEVVNPVGGGDGTSTSVGAADGIPTHLPHISLPKQLLVLHIC